MITYGRIVSLTRQAIINDDLSVFTKIPNRMGRAAKRTIAIVDAYGYPNAEADLAVYRSTFGLPACTTASAVRAALAQITCCRKRATGRPR